MSGHLIVAGNNFLDLFSKENGRTAFPHELHAEKRLVLAWVCGCDAKHLSDELRFLKESRSSNQVDSSPDLDAELPVRGIDILVSALRKAVIAGKFGEEMAHEIFRLAPAEEEVSAR